MLWAANDKARCAPLIFPADTTVSQPADSSVFGMVPAVPEENDKVAKSPGAAGNRCVNVNTAAAKQLELLPGIGPAIASRIIEYRNVHGRIVSLADLDEVKGIGPAKLQKLQNSVCF